MLGGVEGGRRRLLGLEERHRALGEEGEEEGRNRTLGEGEEQNSSEQGEEELSSSEREQEQGLSSSEQEQHSPKELLQNMLQNQNNLLKEEGEQNKLELEQHKLVGHHRRNRPEVKRGKRLESRIFCKTF